MIEFLDIVQVIVMTVLAFAAIGAAVLAGLVLIFGDHGDGDR